MNKLMFLKISKAELMSQLRVSRNGENHAYDNAARSAQMRK